MSNVMQCSKCGREYSFTDEYVSQYAGQASECECGESIPIPSLPATLHEGAETQPTAAREQIGGWQDHGYVVAQKAMKLPRRCFKCNAPLTTQMTPIVLDWRPGEANELGSMVSGWMRSNLFPVDVFGFITSAIKDADTQSIVMRYGRCPAHRARLNKWWLAAGFALLGVTCLIPLIAGWVHAIPIIIVLFGGFLSSMVGAVMAMKLGPPFRIVHFYNNRAWIAGFGKAYVEALPPISKAPPSSR